MDCVNLGRSDSKVSRSCLGTMNFGPFTDKSNSFEIMEKALDAGINLFDTANLYGWELGEMKTEKIIGHRLSKKCVAS